MNYIIKIVYQQAGITEYLTDFIKYHSQWQTNGDINRARQFNTKEEAANTAIDLMHIVSFAKYKADVYVTEAVPFIIWKEGESEFLYI